MTRNQFWEILDEILFTAVAGMGMVLGLATVLWALGFEMRGSILALCWVAFGLMVTLRRYERDSVVWLTVRMTGCTKEQAQAVYDKDKYGETP